MIILAQYVTYRTKVLDPRKGWSPCKGWGHVFFFWCAYFLYYNDYFMRILFWIPNYGVFCGDKYCVDVAEFAFLTIGYDEMTMVYTNTYKYQVKCNGNVCLSAIIM